MKGQIVNSLGFVAYMVSVAMTHLCHCSMKVGIDNTKMNYGDPVIIKLYLKSKCQGSSQDGGIGRNVSLSHTTKKG